MTSNNLPALDASAGWINAERERDRAAIVRTHTLEGA